MIEYKYRVLDSMNHILIDNASLENAILFMKAYMSEYYVDPSIKLTLERISPLPAED